MLKCN